jgi:hypothetical protein
MGETGKPDKPQERAGNSQKVRRRLRTIWTIAVHAFSETALGKRGSPSANSQSNTFLIKTNMLVLVCRQPRREKQGT